MEIPKRTTKTGAPGSADRRSTSPPQSPEEGPGGVRTTEMELPSTRKTDQIGVGTCWRSTGSCSSLSPSCRSPCSELERDPRPRLLGHGPKPAERRQRGYRSSRKSEGDLPALFVAAYISCGAPRRAWCGGGWRLTGRSSGPRPCAARTPWRAAFPRPDVIDITFGFGPVTPE